MGSKQREIPSQVPLSPALTMTFRIKMYKTRITQWGLDKKNKENEMRAIMRKTASRVSKGKDSTFYIRGKTVKFENVVRYWQRNGRSPIDEIIAQREASRTPEAVECFTPVLSPLHNPDELARDERMLAAIRDYQQLSSQATGGSSSVMIQLGGLYDQSMLACKLFEKQSSHEAGQALLKAAKGIQTIVQGLSPDTIHYLLVIMGEILAYGKNEIVISILRQFAAMSDEVLPKEHPFGVIWSRLALMDLSDPSHYNHVQQMSMRVNIECLEKLLGPLHRSTVDAKSDMLASYRNTQDHGQWELGLKSLHRECELALDPDDDRTGWVRLELAYYHLWHDNPMEAKRLAHALCDQTKSNELRVRFLELLAIAQHDLGEMVAAEENIRKAIDSGFMVWGYHDGAVHRMMLSLEGWLAEQGKLASAAQLREERMGYWEPPELL